MKLAVTGFVSEEAGSVASANALLLRQILKERHEIDFFSKPTFVDPRPVVGGQPGFRYVPVVNRGTDGFRRAVGKVPLLGAVAGRMDAAGYNRLLVRKIREECRGRRYDLVLWLGDYARGRVPGVATVSFAQGPPGTDARSVLERCAEIRTVAGIWQAWKWTALAKIRLSRLGLPALGYSDLVIVGSQQSCKTMSQRYGIDPSRLSAMPYPSDVELFKTESGKRKAEGGDDALRVLWLGRIVPRKRLDLFLDGAALAIRQGIEVRLSIVGGVGFVRGYEQLIAAFPFPERLQWTQQVARDRIPDLMRANDVLAQPSDEENFGSSVAEAQACGLPVIVGFTNGNADYLCSRDIHLRDDRAETFSAALGEMADRKNNGRWGDLSESRKMAAEKFDVQSIATQLMETLETVSRRNHDAAPR